jgi:predicted TIM-barrel fold metal-dependent hydrolase
MRCDSHVHIVGPIAQYPQVDNRTYLSARADLAALRQCGATRNIKRFVIVQPSFYGIDNTATLEAVDALGANGRAVAVIDPARTPSDLLYDFNARGVRGLRINLYSGLMGDMSLEAGFGGTVNVAKSRNWHVQVIAGIKVLAANADMLARSPVPVVIDHYGVHGASKPDSDEGRALLALLRQPHVWVKLSGPYRNSTDPLKTQPDKAWLSAILDVAEDRCVWGSDWPFTPPHEEHRGKNIGLANRPIRYEQLVDDFIAAVGSEPRAERIMSENAAKLYGFADH